MSTAKRAKGGRETNSESAQAKKRREQQRCLSEIAAAHNGILRAEDVVAAAKTPRSPLHGEFDWDVRRAAHKYWLEQARVLIRSVRIEVITSDSPREIVVVNEYVHNPDKDVTRTDGYVSIKRLQEDPDLAQRALVEEFSQAASHLRRAYRIATALRMKRRVQNVLTSVEKLSQQVAQ